MTFVKNYPSFDGSERLEVALFERNPIGEGQRVEDIAEIVLGEVVLDDRAETNRCVVIHLKVAIDDLK